MGIWFDWSSIGPTYWSLSSSGHALGLLLIVLVVADALLLAAAAHSSVGFAGAAVLAAAVTFGLSVFVVVGAAFDSFGAVGAGAWIQAAGGTLLLAGVVLPRFVRPGSTASAAAQAA